MIIIPRYVLLKGILSGIILRSAALPNVHAKKLVKNQYRC